MVKGFNKFKEYFADFTDQYVLIGGTACTIVMDHNGMDFRGTKDLDIVLFVEALTSDFLKQFWEFISDGEYRQQNASTGKKQFYRFANPENAAFPEMLELFSRKPDSLIFSGSGHLTPLPTDDESSSLSAILLDTEYYSFIHQGRQTIDRVSVLGPEYLIPIKAKAFIDLSDRRKAGELIDSKSIIKHKNDILRLYPIVVPALIPHLSKTIYDDLTTFIDSLSGEQIDLKQLGYSAKFKASDILKEIAERYKPI